MKKYEQDGKEYYLAQINARSYRNDDDTGEVISAFVLDVVNLPEDKALQTRLYDRLRNETIKFLIEEGVIPADVIAFRADTPEPAPPPQGEMH